MRSTFERLRSFGGGQRLLCKRIANNLRLPLLVEAFPDATFVLLTRDGRAVASSLRKVNWWPGFWVFWYGSTTDQWEAAGGDPWELAARHWVEEVEAIANGLTAVPPDQLISLSYEEFVSDPVERLADIADRSRLGHQRRLVGGAAAPLLPGPQRVLAHPARPGGPGHDRAGPA